MLNLKVNMEEVYNLINKRFHKQLNMTIECHNHRPQTNPWHRKLETKQRQVATRQHEDIKSKATK